MADKLDPQVQIRIIDLAVKWVEMQGRQRIPPGPSIDILADYFDQAYKAIVKTVAGE